MEVSNPVIIAYICLIKNPLFEAVFCIEQDIEGASCSPRHSLWRAFQPEDQRLRLFSPQHRHLHRLLEPFNGRSKVSAQRT